MGEVVVHSGEVVAASGETVAHSAEVVASGTNSGSVGSGGSLEEVVAQLG